MSLIVTKELAQTIELSEIDALHSRLMAMQAIEGNPMGVDIQQFGNATAFSVKNIPGPSFNTVKGLTDGDEQFMDQLIEFYTEKEIRVRFELTPAHASPDLLAHLQQAGFYHSDFHTSLYGSLIQSAVTVDERITIRRLESHEFDLFAEIYAKGFQMPTFLQSGIAQNNVILHGNDHWTFYLASLDDEPAGIGVLFVKDGMATLAAAATVPHLRSKGVQQALIHQRIQHATRLHSRLIVGQAEFGSVSQNNMERAGMKIAYTKAIWVQQ
ncbi:GNAT family N-acetyltransferase [Sporosarcina sp. FSL K6-3457]|uniref:GNAT family N-acetyltransferase n=1 Tax=Sporosarcina sp. FSL K6-3457 TaxID=2978204 RepID=UPI0030FB60AB